MILAYTSQLIQIKAMTISQTRGRDLFIERPCGNDVVKSIVYVEYCEEIQLHRKNAKRRQAAGKWEQYET